ncbi:MAG: cytochrome C [Calditrichaeota bacterium]|nr:cytochrome C [Calditrichota bacterium]
MNRKSLSSAFAVLVYLALVFFVAGVATAENACVTCHAKQDVTPIQVKDWQASKHAANGVTCDVCHGTAHTSAQDVDKVSLPTPDVCAQCHEDKVAEFKRGKHALAWISMNAMPATHYQPMELIEGQKGCGSCHGIGLKSPEDIKKLEAQGIKHGVASCDACHTRHTFSAEEARQPEACATCHMGFDHPQWEMYSTSKHGIRYELKRKGVLPETAAAPKCQTCHMQNGNHEVRTAWGFLAVRLPMPEDKQWAADRVTILKALGVLDPDGKPTARLEAVKAADIARLDQASWQKERDKMVATCSQCHSESFAKAELEKSDQIIRQADRLMAEAIETVAGLYKDGILKKPDSYAYAYPDLLTFNEAATGIEQDLFEMFLKHRMRTFQGSFHANPDYTFWYGWNEMRKDLTKIKEEAELLRHRHAMHGEK